MVIINSKLKIPVLKFAVYLFTVYLQMSTHCQMKSYALHLFIS